LPDGDEKFLEAADRLGSRLCRDAICFNGRCNWIGASLEPVGQSWTVVQRAFGPDLYAGTSGIALFLARLYDLTREPVHRKIGQAAVAQSRSQIDRLRDTGGSGFYSGMTGVAYAWSEIDGILGGGDLTAQARTLLSEVAASNVELAGLDVVSGCAGAIPVLLAMNRRLDEPTLREFAVRLGERLLSTAKPRNTGMSWHTIDVPAIDDLTGFSHGAAGIAWALLELFAETGDDRFNQAANAGFAYERACYSAEHKNWPDFRVFGPQPVSAESKPSYGLAWCHGAPGIGLSRLRAYALTGDVTYRNETNAAVTATVEGLRQPNYLGNYSLCHGLFGNADLLIDAGAALHDPTLKNEARVLGMRALERHHDDDQPWPCGVPAGPETPGLMLGIAGIGYFYLRLFDSVKNPSVLCVGGLEVK